MTAGSINLSVECLFSKWGFNDGEMPSEYFDWIFDTKGNELISGLAYSESWHKTLIVLVKEYLMPLLRNHDVELYEIWTHHNPIRARYFDGYPVNTYDSDQDFEYDKTISVDVPFEKVYEIHRKLVPHSII